MMTMTPLPPPLQKMNMLPLLPPQLLLPLVAASLEPGLS
jgi:hypothetical protein